MAGGAGRGAPGCREPRLVVVPLQVGEERERPGREGHGRRCRPAVMRLPWPRGWRGRRAPGRHPGGGGMPPPPPPPPGGGPLIELDEDMPPPPPPVIPPPPPDKETTPL